MQALATRSSHFSHKIATPSYVSTHSTIHHMQSSLSRCVLTCTCATLLSSHQLVVGQQNVLYTSPPCGAITAAVWDLSSTSPPPGLAPRSADILVLVFVLSALHPSEWPRAISNIAQVWKSLSHPGPHICLSQDSNTPIHLDT